VEVGMRAKKVVGVRESSEKLGENINEITRPHPS